MELIKKYSPNSSNWRSLFNFKKLTLPINHIIKENSLIILIGKTFGHLYQSALFEEIYSLIDGPPEINLVNEKNNGEAVLKLINERLALSVLYFLWRINCSACRNVYEVKLWYKIEKPKKLTNLFEYFFGEDQGRC